MRNGLPVLVGGLVGLVAFGGTQAQEPPKFIRAVEIKAPPPIPPLLERRVLQIEKTSNPPKLDSRLDDECWKTAAVTGDLMMNAGSKHSTPMPKATFLRACYDDKNLYLAFECMDPDAKNVLAAYTKRDSPFWLEDDIEFMIDSAYDRRTFYQFLFNAAGGQGDYKFWFKDNRVEGTEKYDPPWEVKAKVADDRWAAEVVLPFSSVETEGVAPGAKWGFNFCRIENPGGLLGNWTRTNDHRDPRLFGDLVFGRAPYVLDDVDLGVAMRGVNLLRANLTNNTKEAKPLRVSATVLADGAPFATTVAEKNIPAEKSEAVMLPYEAPMTDKDAKLEVALVDPKKDKALIKRTYELRLDPPLATRIESTEYYEKDKDVRVQTSIRVGDLTGATSRLAAKLFAQDGKTLLRTDASSPIPRGDSAIVLNVSDLKTGSYVLELSLEDASGRTLATQRMAFDKSKSLMDF